jgi:hypothetical protein
LQAVATTVVAALSVLTASGCGGDGLPRQGVSGSVSVDGKPLKSGSITFVPTEPDTPTQGGATVVDGSYSIPSAQGLVPGKYKVVLSSGEGTAEKKVDSTNDMPGMPPVPAKEVIPSQYGAQSVLEAGVTAGGKNQFDFNLTAGAQGKGK